jgi:uncharacterized protein (TIGR03067 family)
MVICGVTALVAVLVSPAANGADPEPGMTLLDKARGEDGFIPIFNGKDLTGWDGNPKLWSVKDGAITGQTTTENPAKVNTFLIWTNGTVGDFELRCTFKLVANNDQGFCNSGIQYRSQVLDPANWVVGGYQADMEAGPNYTGILYEERKKRAIMAQRGEIVVWDKECKKQVVGSLGKAEDIEASLKKGDWNDYMIIAQGNHLRQWVNGKPTIDVTDDCEAQRAMTGILALQLHVGGAMTAQFKNIRIKTLSAVDHATAASTEDLKPLQGVWAATQMELDGTKIPDAGVTNTVLIIKGDGYRVVTGGQLADEGTLSFSGSQQPRQLDIHPAKGPHAGIPIPSIYEVAGNHMRVCYAVRNAPRPASFETSANSGRLLISYERKP